MAEKPGLDTHVIIEAAAQMANIEGLHQITLAKLARKLGVRSPSLYNHIHGLPGLHKQLSIHGIRKLQEHLTIAAVGRSGDDAVKAMAHAYLAFAQANYGLYQAIQQAPGTDTDPDADHSDWHQASEDIVHLLVQVMQSYDLDETQSLHAVRILRSCLHGFASLQYSGGFGLPLQIETTIDLLIETIIAGIRKLQQQTGR